MRSYFEHDGQRRSNKSQIEINDVRRTYHRRRRNSLMHVDVLLDMDDGHSVDEAECSEEDFDEGMVPLTSKSNIDVFPWDNEVEGISASEIDTRGQHASVSRRASLSR